jgi:Protein of unknown function (DUF3010)
MIICGVELTANDAVICLLNLDAQQFNIPDCRVRKLSLQKNHSRENLRHFQTSFAKLMADYGVDKVVIRERAVKGKFAGGAVSFKLESAIQLIADLEVELLSATTIKNALTESPLPVPFADTGLKVFQEAAFNVAYAAQVLR